MPKKRKTESAERSKAGESDEEVESIRKFNQATKLPFYCLSLLHTEHPELKIFGMECADGSVLMYWQTSIRATNMLIKWTWISPRRIHRTGFNSIGKCVHQSVWYSFAHSYHRTYVRISKWCNCMLQYLVRSAVYGCITHPILFHPLSRRLLLWRWCFSLVFIALCAMYWISAFNYRYFSMSVQSTKS